MVLVGENLQDHQVQTLYAEKHDPEQLFDINVVLKASLHLGLS